MKISVAIPTFQRPDFALQTVREVLRVKEDEVGEILVIDQSEWEGYPASTQDEVARLVENGEVRWMFLREPNLPGARNVALAMARFPIVSFLDDDVLLPEGYFSRHQQLYSDSDQSRRVIAVCGPWHTRNASSDISKLSVSNPTHLTRPMFFVGRDFDDDWPHHLPGGCHSVLRDAAVAVGGYDENFSGGAFSEDVEFTYRLRDSKKGRIVFSSGCWLLHINAPTGGCRILKTRRFSESKKIRGFFLIGFRRPEYRSFLKIFRGALRAGPFRKECVMFPPKLFVAGWGFLHAMAWSWRARNRIKSPFRPNALSRFEWEDSGPVKHRFLETFE